MAMHGFDSIKGKIKLIINVLNQMYNFWGRNHNLLQLNFPTSPGMGIYFSFKVINNKSM